MDVAAHSAWLVILLGIASTTQTHLAKALERQGIEIWDLIKARLRSRDLPASVAGESGGSGRAGGCGEQGASPGKAPLLYLIGLTLNHTTFVYHLLVTPLGGTTALYTSMYGVGLVALLAYSTWVLKERMSRPEWLGSVAILSGTLVIGLEGVARPPLGMAAIDLRVAASAVIALLVGGGVLVAGGIRSRSPKAMGLMFGLTAGTLGSLDPFLKGVGQTAGGLGRFLPGLPVGWAVLAFSFVVGEAAVVVTQWGFYRRARTTILVPAYNCSYIAVPIGLQALLLPGYVLYGTTFLGLGLIIAGFGLLRGLRPRWAPAAAEGLSQPEARAG
jgi:hypothetical protein